MSKAQRQRKGLHWALSQPPPCGVNTQGQNINKPKQGKTEGKKNKQGRRKERKCNIFQMRKHQPWALPTSRAERAKGLTPVTQRNNNECYLPNKEVGFVTCDLSLEHRGRQQLVPPPQGKRKLQLSKPSELPAPISHRRLPPLHPTAGAKQEILCQTGSDPSSSITANAPFPGILLQDAAPRGLFPAAPPAISPLTYRWIFPDEGAAQN